MYGALERPSLSGTGPGALADVATLPILEEPVQTCFHPQHSGCSRKSSACESGDPRVQPQSCFCGSGSGILSPHPLPTLKMGTFKEIGTFKEKPSLRVGRMVSWKQHAGPAGEGSWIRVTEMRPCPPDGLPPHSCLPWDCLAEAASVRAHFALNTNGILFPQE